MLFQAWQPFFLKNGHVFLVFSMIFAYIQKQESANPSFRAKFALNGSVNRRVTCVS